MKIVVGGLGVVTPIGLECNSFWKSLRGKTSNFSLHQSKYRHIHQPLITSQITNHHRAEIARAVVDNCNLHSTIEVAGLYLLQAAHEALSDASLFDDIGRAGRIGVVLGNLEPNSRPYDLASKSEIALPSHNSYRLYPPVNLLTCLRPLVPNPIIELIVHNTCASGNAALELGEALLREGVIDTAIVGAADAFSERILAGFNALGVVGSQQCRPFSKFRKFISVSEGAAVVVLQNEDKVTKTPYAELVAVGSSNDAHHPTNPSRQGIDRALDILFERASIEGRDISFIYAHGTGSRANDEIEAAIFAERYPASHCVAIKGTVGHTMGVAGALGIVASALTASTGILPPNNILEEEIEYPIGISTREVQANGSFYVQNNAFGFGGSNSVSLFRSFPGRILGEVA